MRGSGKREYTGAMQAVAAREPENSVIFRVGTGQTSTVTRNSGGATSLYYYGARYLDPKTSRWISADPAMGEYIPSPGQGMDKLPGMGGVFNTINLHCFHYAGNNPIVMIDPDGEIIWKQFLLALVQTIGGGLEVGAGVAGAVPTVGASAFAIVHGSVNIMDGFAGMTSAIADIEYGGMVYEAAKEIFSRNGNYDADTVEFMSNIAALAEGIASGKITNGSSFVKILGSSGKDLDNLAKIANFLRNSSSGIDALSVFLEEYTGTNDVLQYSAQMGADRNQVGPGGRSNPASPAREQPRPEQFRSVLGYGL